MSRNTEMSEAMRTLLSFQRVGTTMALAPWRAIYEVAEEHDELLEALEVMQKNWHHMIGFSSPEEWHKMNDKAVAAIAKAKGEDQ